MSPKRKRRVTEAERARIRRHALWIASIPGFFESEVRSMQRFVRAERMRVKPHLVMP